MIIFKLTSVDNMTLFVLSGCYPLPNIIIFLKYHQDDQQDDRQSSEFLFLQHL